MPWGQSPRKLGGDVHPGGNALWVPNWFGQNMTKVDIHTLKMTEYPYPWLDGHGYQTSVDKDHNVWLVFQNGDYVAKFDPKTEQWTRYDLPTRGGESHGIQMVTVDGRTVGAVAVLGRRPGGEAGVPNERRTGSVESGSLADGEAVGDMVALHNRGSHRRGSNPPCRNVQVALVLAGALVAGRGLSASSASPTTLIEQRGTPAAAAVDAQIVRYPTDGATLEAYLAKPRSAGRHQAVIVVHDNQGLNEIIRQVARQLAQAGFVALAPNLLSRADGSPTSPRSESAGMPAPPAVNQLPLRQTVDDLKAAFNFAQQAADVDSGNISVIGFGWGGWRTYKLAQEIPTLHRAVVFYGVTPSEDRVSDIRVPILAHYAQYDFSITSLALRTQKQLGRKFTYDIYTGTERGFFAGGGDSNSPFYMEGGGATDAAARSTAASAPSPAAAAAVNLAWRRTLAFLR